jgi:Zn-dependent protease with chaperone function
MALEMKPKWQDAFEQGKLACAAENFALAESQFASALELSYDEGAPDTSVAEIFFSQGWCFHAQKKNIEAQRSYGQALATFERCRGSASIEVAEVLQNLGSLLCETGRTTQARPLFERAFIVIKRTYGESNPEVLAIKEQMDQVLTYHSLNTTETSAPPIPQKADSDAETSPSSAPGWLLQSLDTSVAAEKLLPEPNQFTQNGKHESSAKDEAQSQSFPQPQSNGTVSSDGSGNMPVEIAPVYNSIPVFDTASAEGTTSSFQSGPLFDGGPLFETAPVVQATTTPFQSGPLFDTGPSSQTAPAAQSPPALESTPSIPGGEALLTSGAARVLDSLPVSNTETLNSKSSVPSQTWGTPPKLPEAPQPVNAPTTTPYVNAGDQRAQSWDNQTEASATLDERPADVAPKQAPQTWGVPPALPSASNDEAPKIPANLQPPPIPPKVQPAAISQAPENRNQPQHTPPVPGVFYAPAAPKDVHGMPPLPSQQPNIPPVPGTTEAKALVDPASQQAKRRLPRSFGIGTESADETYDDMLANVQGHQGAALGLEELVHPREQFYGTVSSILGWILYGMSFCLLFGLFLAPVFLIGAWISGGICKGHLRAHSIKISERQFPEVHAMVQEYSEKLGIKPPQVYVCHYDGVLNAFTNRFQNRDYITIASDVFEMAYQQGEREIAFVLCHELAHVKRGHVKWAWLHTPASFIPFFGNAYSRACEYTCDRIARYLVPDGALFGLVALAAGTTLYKHVNLRALYQQQEEEWDFWTWFSEIESTHPNLLNRIRAIGLTEEREAAAANRSIPKFGRNP